jgi:hypothetical protein
VDDVQQDDLVAAARHGRDPALAQAADGCRAAHSVRRYGLR